MIKSVDSAEPATSSTRAAATRRGSSLDRPSALTLAALRDPARAVHRATSTIQQLPIATIRNRALRAGILQGQTITKVYLTVRCAILLVPPEVIAHHKLPRARPVQTDIMEQRQGQVLLVRNAQIHVPPVPVQQHSAPRVRILINTSRRARVMTERARASLKMHAQILTSPQPPQTARRSAPPATMLQTGA